MRTILAALPRARVVGGAVRDAIAERPSADVDFATPERPEAVVVALAEAGIRSVPTGLEHGTVTAVVAGRGFEITTLRRDVETDGRHAVVAFTTDWQADAARRDFTMNAMSMDGGGGVFDYHGGIGDLQAGIVRFVGDPASRIREDYLRLLRYFRFYARYAAAPPDAAVCRAIQDGVSGLASLSVERVWNELTRILATPDPRRALSLMSRLGVLAAVLPEAGDLRGLDRLVAADAPVDPLLRLAAILGGDLPGVTSGAAPAASLPRASLPGARPPGARATRASSPGASLTNAPGQLSEVALRVAGRLKLSGADRDRLLALGGQPVPHPSADEDTLRRMLADADASTLQGRTWLIGDADPAWDALRRRLAAMKRPVFPVSGKHALALGIAPGPRVGTLLEEVRRWWLDGGCRADETACVARLRLRAGID